MEYETKVEPGQALSLGGSVGLHNVFTGVVYFGKKRVASTRMYSDKGVAAREAGKLAKRYREYREYYGEGYEEKRQRERDKKEIVRRRRGARSKFSMRGLDILERLVNQTDRDDRPGVEATLEEARALLVEAQSAEAEAVRKYHKARKGY